MGYLRSCIVCTKILCHASLHVKSLCTILPQPQVIKDGEMTTSVEVSTPYLTEHKLNVILTEKNPVVDRGDGVETHH